MSQFEVELPINADHIMFAVCRMNLEGVYDTPEEAEAALTPGAFVAEVVPKETYDAAVEAEVHAVLNGKDIPPRSRWIVQKFGDVYLIRNGFESPVDEQGNDR